MESQATEKGVDREFVKLIKVNSVIRKGLSGNGSHKRGRSNSKRVTPPGSIIN